MCGEGGLIECWVWACSMGSGALDGGGLGMEGERKGMGLTWGRPSCGSAAPEEVNPPVVSFVCE